MSPGPVAGISMQSMISRSPAEADTVYDADHPAARRRLASNRYQRHCNPSNPINFNSNKANVLTTHFAAGDLATLDVTIEQAQHFRVGAILAI
jgi:hypothetical protein